MGERATKILLLEDHVDTAVAWSVLLRRLSYEVRVALTCADARLAAEAETFDVLVSEIGLPDGDGCELLKELHERYGLMGVALTAEVFPNHVERCREAGFLHFLAKPTGIARLREAIDDVVGRRLR